MLGRQIKIYLFSKGISQTYIAAKTGIPNPILSAMLNGRRKIKAEEYFAICKALEVSVEKFVEEVV